MARLATVTPLPPADDTVELTGNLTQLFRQARTARKPRVATWVKNYKVLTNQTSSSLTREPWTPSASIPEVLPIVASIVGWMTDQRPRFNISPECPPGTSFYGWYSSVAQDLQTVLQAVWHNQNYDAAIERVCWDGWTYGLGWFKTAWDDTLVGGLGDATLTRVDPFALYPDPGAQTVEQCNYFVEAYRISRQELDRRFPGAASKVSSAASDDIDQIPNLLTTQPSQLPRANPGRIGATTPSGWGLPGQSRLSSTDTSDDGITCLEFWIRSHKREKVKWQSDRITLDEWRVIVLAGNTIVFDEKATDLWSHGQHPYIRYVPMDLGEMFGISMVELLAPSQLAINQLLASLQLNVMLSGNPVWVEGTNSNLQRTKVTNKPGQRLTKTAGSEAGWLNPPPVHPMMAELVKFHLGEMERISGLSAVVRGAVPSGRNAEGTLDSIQEASFVRIRLALRNLERALTRAGQLAASLIAENYTTPRIVAITGPDGTRSALALTGRQFYTPTDNGEEPLRFTLNVEVGSTLPTSRKQKAAEADTLFALGAIDEQALLEAHEWPNRALVGQRVVDRKAQGTLEPPGARQRAQRTS